MIQRAWAHVQRAKEHGVELKELKLRHPVAVLAERAVHSDEREIKVPEHMIGQEGECVS